MLDNFNIFPPKKEIIAISLQKNTKEITDIINSEIGKKIFRESSLNGFISFNSYNSSIIKEKLSEFLSSNNNQFNICKVMENLSDEKYLIPRQYNAKYKMTRFYRTIFLDGESVFNLSSFETFYTNEFFADGVVVRIIPDKYLIDNIEAIIEKCKTVTEPVIFVVPQGKTIPQSTLNLFKEYYALNALNQKLGKDDLIRNEIILIKSELSKDLKDIIKHVYSGAVNVPSSEDNISKIISEQLEKRFQTPIINNELINGAVS